MIHTCSKMCNLAFTSFTSLRQVVAFSSHAFALRSDSDAFALASHTFTLSSDIIGMFSDAAAMTVVINCDAIVHRREHVLQ